MLKSNRRDFLKFAGIAGATSALGLTFSLPSSRISAQQPEGMQGTVTIIPTAVGHIHTYTAPDVSSRVTTHIIETADSLVLIDAQLFKPFGAEAAAYAASLGKPIDRIILSHDHPDHWYGAESFDAPLVATATSAGLIQEAVESGSAASQASSFGDLAATEFRVPEVGVELGSETIAGINFEFSAIENAEAVENLVVLVPEAKTAILQDLMYNAVYFFPGLNRPNWIAALEDMRTSLKADGYEIILPGHGVPTTLGTLDTGIEFLQFLDEQFNTADSGEAVAEAIVARYPSFDGAGLLPFYSLFFQ